MKTMGIINTKGKHRYYYFNGNKRNKREIRNIFNDIKTLKEKPYPKGDNKEYDASGKIVNQQRLF